MGVKIDIDELLQAFRGEFVTKDACFNKKDSYVRLDICSERTKEMNIKMEKIENHLNNIDIKLNNHITHIAADIATIKTQLKENEEPKENMWKNGLVMKLVGFIALLIGTIIYLVEIKIGG